MRKFFTNRKKLCTFLYILGFCTSGAFTLMLLQSNSVDTLSKWLAVSMTVILEFGKGISFVESQKKGKYSDGMTSLLFGLWIFTTLLSIFASQAFLVNETNKTANNSILSSSEYRQTQDKESRTKEQIELKKKLLDKAIGDKAANSSAADKQRKENTRLIDEYNQTIKSYQSQIANKNEQLQQAINKKYVNTPGKLRNEITQLTDAMNKTISARDRLSVNDKSDIDHAAIQKLSGEIDALNRDLNSINYGEIHSSLSSENGYIAIFQLIADFTGKSVKVITFLFYLTITIGFEVLICLLYHIAVIHSDETYNHKIRTDNKHIGFNAQTLTASNVSDNYNGNITCYSNEYPKNPTASNVIGFRFEKNDPSPLAIIHSDAEPDAQPVSNNIYLDINRDDVLRYLEHMYRFQKDGISPGMRKIARKINMYEEQARKIKGYLETLRIIESNGANTYILCEHSEAVRRI